MAALLRRDLAEASSTPYRLRSFATFVASEPDRSTIAYAGRFNPDTDVGCTSVRGGGAGGAEAFPEFGALLGRPDFIRRPATAAFPGLVALLPGSPDGDCDVWACLRDADLEALNADETWRDFVEYIG